MTTDELQIATQLTDSVLKTTLVSLVKTKVYEAYPWWHLSYNPQILNMDPPGEDDDITKTHKFSLNSGFKRYALEKKMAGSILILL